MRSYGLWHLQGWPSDGEAEAIAAVAVYEVVGDHEGAGADPDRGLCGGGTGHEEEGERQEAAGERHSNGLPEIRKRTDQESVGCAFAGRKPPGKMWLSSTTTTRRLPCWEKIA